MHRVAAYRTLVAECDEDRASIVRAALVESNHRVDVAASLADALALLDDEHRDCLVLALEAEDDRLDALRALCERHPGLAVVALGGEDDPALVRAALAAGAQDCVVATEPQLGRIVDRAIARTGVVRGLRERAHRQRAVINGLPGLGAVAFDQQMCVSILEGPGRGSVGDYQLDYPGQPAVEVFGPELMEIFEPWWRRALAGERFTIDWTSDIDGHEHVSHFSPMLDARGRLVGGMSVVVDIHDRVRTESVLAQTERRCAALAEGVPLGIAEFDVDGLCRYINGRYAELLGIAPGDALGRPWSDFPHADDVDAVMHEWLTASAEGREFRLDYRLGRSDGDVVWVAARVREMFDEDGACTGYFGTVADIQERRMADEALREAMALFSAAFEHAPVAMGIFSVDGRYQQVNPALCTLLGRSEEEILGRLWQEFVHTDHQEDSVPALTALVNGVVDKHESEGCLSRPDGTPVWTLLRTTVVRAEDGEPRHLFAQMVDIGKRRIEEAELRHLADHDVVTGLVNRRRFEAELTRKIAENRRAGRGGAVLVLDLDRFKAVNDEHGHHAGDRMLVDVAKVLGQRLRSTDVVGRIGGDEFAILLLEGDEDEARAVTEMLSAAIAETGITASIGVTTLDPGDTSAEQVLVRADLAMYEEKRRGRQAPVSQYFSW